MDCKHGIEAAWCAYCTGETPIVLSWQAGAEDDDESFPVTRRAEIKREIAEELQVILSWDEKPPAPASKPKEAPVPPKIVRLQESEPPEPKKAVSWRVIFQRVIRDGRVFVSRKIVRRRTAPDRGRN